MHKAPFAPKSFAFSIHDRGGRELCVLAATDDPYFSSFFFFPFIIFVSHHL